MDPSDDFDRRHLDAIADADLFPYWYDDVDEPESNPTWCALGTNAFKPLLGRSTTTA
jgi:hypothetical protein